MTEQKLVIVTTAYNCEDYIQRCLWSIQNQSYKNFECYIFNDISTDNTVEKCKEFLEADPRFLLIDNEKKRFQAGNYDYLIRESGLVQDEDIIVEVDGDDFLPDQDVFRRVCDYYSDGNTWLTYGQFVIERNESFAKGFTTEANIEDMRSERFTASHLRTWKAWLWNKIKQEDLLVDGLYPESASDVYFMFPMIEMCGKEHSKFVEDINYVYNEGNPMGDMKGERFQKTVHFERVGKQKPKYERITK